LLATAKAALVSLLDTGIVQWKEQAPPAENDRIVAAVERDVAAVNQRRERLDEAGWQKKVRMLMDGGAAGEDTIGEMVWGFLFDEVHHRGQLSTFLRPIGGKVPSIYGPSADDPGR
jgi:uncharacterized damage-inducible protein DinB